MTSIIRGNDNFDSANALTILSELLQADDGYVELSNGLIIQWGRHPTDGTVTLPKAYTTSHFIALANIESSSASAISDEEIRIHTLTLTSFTYLVINVNRPIFWLSIGI